MGPPKAYRGILLGGDFVQKTKQETLALRVLSKNAQQNLKFLLYDMSATCFVFLDKSSVQIAARPGQPLLGSGETFHPSDIDETQSPICSAENIEKGQKHARLLHQKALTIEDTR